MLKKIVNCLIKIINFIVIILAIGSICTFKADREISVSFIICGGMFICFSMIAKSFLDKHTNEFYEAEKNNSSNLHNNSPASVPSLSSISKSKEKNLTLGSIIENNELINKDYTLPQTDLLQEISSQSILPFLEKMKGQSHINIPIGMCHGEVILESISKMPNLLIGGTVMSGKTSYINTIISSILLTKKPNEIKLLIFDFKRVDYSIYNGIPHLLCPIITDSKKGNIALQKIALEIDRRINKLREQNIKTVDFYNREFGDSNFMPDIIVIIDSLNGINDVSSEYIDFISSNGWNVNVYMIVSANSPTSQIIPTISKANFPSRLSFRVAGLRDSRIILDDEGAERLSNLGDALYKSRFSESILKIKVPYIADDDTLRIIKEVCHQEEFVYSPLFLKSAEEIKEETQREWEYDDPLYNEIVEFTIKTGVVSASIIQRRFRLGYNRAARIVDLLEERGIIGPQNGSKPREVLVKLEGAEKEE